MITKERQLELKAERDLTTILYAARSNSKVMHTLTPEEIQNVINYYLWLLHEFPTGNTTVTNRPSTRNMYA